VSDALLLDTNVLIWTLSASGKVSPAAKRAMSRSCATLSVSAVSVWEIVLKHQAGKLHLEAPLDEVVDLILYRSPWSILPIRPEHLVPLASLPMIHKDPFDRLLIAQALHERMVIVTSDGNMAKYDVRVTW
jgi:PIN domain nuclease of toxin-antitoxin system